MLDAPGSGVRVCERVPYSWRTKVRNLANEMRRHPRALREELARGAAELVRLEIEEPLGPIERPRTRGDCASVPRPCPFVGCRHNLYLDVSRDGRAIKFAFPELDPEEMAADASCSLDVAERGEQTLEEAGETMRLTRERVRQLEGEALAKLHARLRAAGDETPEGTHKRRLPVLEP